MTTQVLQGSLVLADGIAHGGQVVVENGMIQEIVTDGPHFQPTDDFGSAFLLPGLIDVHIHGIAGVDVMDGSRASLELMAERVTAHGVTGFLPTTVTASLDATRAAIVAVRDYIETAPTERARVLGIHLEGPFINASFKGMQDEAHILAPDDATIRTLLACGGGYVTRVSLAPEMPHADHLIELLRDAGVRVSIAHTGASYDQALHAVRLGATHVTHCFNAMTGIHHRAPGVAGAAMLCDDLYAELIADGIHIHPAIMRLLIRSKGRERVMLVTDSMPATGMPDGHYRFGGHDVGVKDGVACLANRTLAGSTVTMDAAVRNLVRLCGVSLVDATYMASTTPAAAMDLSTRKGMLSAGHDADLAVLDPALQPVATWVAGKPCFAAQ